MEKSLEKLVTVNAALVDVIDISNNALVASTDTNKTLHSKLEAAEEKILKISSVKSTCEANCKDMKKGHMNEIMQAKSTIKSLEQGTKGVEKEIHNLKKHLETTRAKVTNLKNSNSSLKINKSKLQAEIANLKKVVRQKDSNITKHRKKKNLDVNENPVTLQDSEHQH